MIVDYTSEIYSGEIWKKSRCLEHEHRVNQRLFDLLHCQGFEKTDHFRIWKKNHKTVIVCLVDDIRSCSPDYHTDLPYLFNSNTTVITDNHVTCPTVFSVKNLPVSFFGIYNYTSDAHKWQPEKDFAFQVNRIDARRFKLMVDLAWRTRLDSGYINFNCEDRNHPEVSVESIFLNQWSSFGEADQKYQSAATRLVPMMPLKNYNMDFDLVPYRVWMNLVVETYSSDSTITLSEKIFRALITPAPWTVYSGRYTVAYLESLGFDCMSDIIDHNHYDRLKEVENKLGIFNWKSLEIAKHLKELGEDQVRDRCLQASLTNQHRLAEFQRNRQQDFDRWLSNIKI
jgi:ribosomal protein S15P/S13E